MTGGMAQGTLGRIAVESGVPLPVKYPFDEMAVGDSFAVPAGVSRTTIGVAALRFGRANGGQRFTIRKTEDGFRCWRTK